MKKGIGIVIFIVIVIISLGLSIYLPNKDKINDEAEDKSVIYSVIEENGKYGVKNQDEKVIVKPQYEQVVIPNEHRGIFICDNDGEKTVVYNENDFLNFYPEIYKIVNPMVCKICENNNEPITKELIQKMTDEVYNNLEETETTTVVNVNASFNNSSSKMDR